MNTEDPFPAPNPCAQAEHQENYAYSVLLAGVCVWGGGARTGEDTVATPGRRWVRDKRLHSYKWESWLQPDAITLFLCDLDQLPVPLCAACLYVSSTAEKIN